LEDQGGVPLFGPIGGRKEFHKEEERKKYHGFLRKGAPWEDDAGGGRSQWRTVSQENYLIMIGEEVGGPPSMGLKGSILNHTHTL